MIENLLLSTRTEPKQTRLSPREPTSFKCDIISGEWHFAASKGRWSEKMRQFWVKRFVQNVCCDKAKNMQKIVSNIHKYDSYYRHTVGEASKNNWLDRLEICVRQEKDYRNTGIFKIIFTCLGHSFYRQKKTFATKDKPPLTHAKLIFEWRRFWLLGNGILLAEECYLANALHLTLINNMFCS